MALSCADGRSYNIVFETLCACGSAVTCSFEPLLQVMLRTIESYPSSLDLVAALLKCLLAFV